MKNYQQKLQLAEYISGFEFKPINLPIEKEGLQVFAIRSNHQFSKPLIELSQALLQGLAEVAEMGTEGTVQQLSVNNNSDHYLLIYEGTLLTGAKQNRIINATVLLPPKSNNSIPASCVESGRWSYSSRKFKKSPYDAPSYLRNTVRSSIFTSKDLQGSQTDVWDKIRMTSDKFSINSSTMDFEEIYRQSPKSEQLFPNGLNLPPTKGIIVNGKGECSLDYVANESAFSGVKDRLIRGYEFLNHEQVNEEVNDLKELILNSLNEGEIFSQPSLNSGTDVRIQSSLYLISALFMEDEIVSMSLTTK